MWQFWLIAAGVFFIAEIATMGFLVFWLGVGSLFAMIVSFFTDNLVVQTAVFVISSIILLLTTKPFVNKFVNKKKNVKTNCYSLIGDEGIVTEDINTLESTGQVKVNGEVWSATCDDDLTIAKGSAIKVVKVNGVKLFVKPIKEDVKEKEVVTK